MGQIYQVHDQSGLRTNKRFDFHGNCVNSSVQYAVEYKQALDWSLDIELDNTEYDLEASFNAIGRAVKVQDFSGEAVQRTYDVANRLRSLKSLARDGTPIASVDEMEYSEDGKIIRVKYGNDSCTTHEYDAKTRRLAKTCTRHSRSGVMLEEVTYTRDCLGRVVHRNDRAQQTIHLDNNAATPSQEFRYDALGQLVEATGREQVDASKGGQKRLRPYDMFSGRQSVALGSGTQAIEYVETYKYDLAGNMLQMRHAPRNADGYSGWTRTYTYKEASHVNPNVIGNRLSSTTIGETTETYGYDGAGGENGCVTSIPGYSTLSWDHDGRLRSFSTQRVTADGGATPEMTWYVYDAGGERVRKITERGTPRGSVSPPAKSKDTRFLPLRDICVRFGGDGSSIIRTVTTASVGDAGLAGGPIALVEHDSSTTQQVIRYQVSQQLELDDDSRVVSYEEFFPYGCSTYQARKTAAPRKYRFIRYQHDHESGLYLCGARYYSPWLGRWTSPDPLGVVDGLNVYAYVSNDPVNFDDQQGTVKKKPQAAGGPSTSDAGGSGTTPAGAPGVAQAHRGTEAAASFSVDSTRRAQDSRAAIAGPKSPNNKGKSLDTAQKPQVQVALENIYYSQVSIAPEIHSPITGTKTPIEGELEKLARQWEDIKGKIKDSSTAASRAAEIFMGDMGTIEVLPLDDQSVNQLLTRLTAPGWTDFKENVQRIQTHSNSEKCLTLDNRRVYIMKKGLPGSTMIWANKIKIDEIKPRELRKLTTTNGGQSILVRGSKQNETQAGREGILK